MNVPKHFDCDCNTDLGVFESVISESPRAGMGLTNHDFKAEVTLIDAGTVLDAKVTWHGSMAGWPV